MISSCCLCIVSYAFLWLCHSTAAFAPRRLSKQRMSTTDSTSLIELDDAASLMHAELNEFDIELALVLGAYSFDVYKDPSISKQSIGLDATSITFHSTEIIKRLSRGVVLGKIFRGQFSNVEETQLAERLLTGGNIDPYLTLWLDESTTNAGSRVLDSITSSMKQNTAKPEWNETFTLYAKDPYSTVLKVVVKDKDLLREDDVLGCGKFNLGNLLYAAKANNKGSDNAQRLPIPLYRETVKKDWFGRVTTGRKRTGTVLLDVQYVPWEDESTESSSTNETYNGKNKIKVPQGATPGVDWERILLSSVQRFSLESYWPRRASDKLIKSMHHQLQHVCSVDNPDTDTQAAVWADFRKKVLLISFRGTEQIKVKDIMTDINLFQSHYFPQYMWGSDPLMGSVLIHTGFLQAFQSVRAALIQLMHAILTAPPVEGEVDDPWRIHITGHSLGGALASLMSFELARLREGMYVTDIKMKKSVDVSDGDIEQGILMDQWVNEASSDTIDYGALYMQDAGFKTALGAAEIVTYTYGAPRVGNPSYADLCDKISPFNYRIINKKDVVPRVPRSTLTNTVLEYKHAGRSVVLHEEDEGDEKVKEKEKGGRRVSLWVEGVSAGASPVRDVKPFPNTATDKSPLVQLENTLRPIIEKQKRPQQPVNNNNNNGTSNDKSMLEVSAENAMNKFFSSMPVLIDLVHMDMDTEEMKRLEGLYTTLRDISGGIDEGFVVREIELLNSILDKRALEHHLEPSYFTSLSRVLKQERKKEV